MEFGTYITYQQLEDLFGMTPIEAREAVLAFGFTVIEMYGRTRIRLNKADMALLDVWFTAEKELRYL